MYPILLDPTCLRAVLVGAGRAAVRRYDGLVSAGASDVRVFCPQPGDELAERAESHLVGDLPGPDALTGANLVLVAGLADDLSGRIADMARDRNILVNVEDRRPWCDFHVPAVVRRGDMLLTASTGGKCPGLAGSLRRRLAADFGPEWADRLEEIAARRSRWKASGDDQATLARKTKQWIDRSGWFG